MVGFGRSLAAAPTTMGCRDKALRRSMADNAMRIHRYLGSFSLVLAAACAPHPNRTEAATDLEQTAGRESSAGTVDDAHPADVRACKSLAGAVDGKPVAGYVAASAGRFALTFALVPFILAGAAVAPNSTGLAFRSLEPVYSGPGAWDGLRNARQNYHDRERIADGCLEVLQAERQVGADDIRLVEPLTRFADAYAAAAAHPEAAQLYQRALILQEKWGAEDDRQIEAIVVPYIAVLQRLERSEEARAVGARIGLHAVGKSDPPRPVARYENPFDPRGDWVSCAVAGERKWTWRSECD